MNTVKKPILSFDLRSATAQDAEFLYRLYSTTRMDELNAAGFPEDEREQFLRMQFDLQNTHYERFYPGAEDRIIITAASDDNGGDDKCAGAAAGTAIGREYVYLSEDEILLVDIALLPEFCGKGIGTVLLEKLCRESARTGKPLKLYALKFNNRVLRLYERFGFNIIDDTGVYYLLEWR